jgi:eukaryotic-like serine/threonine-protein kinase
MSLVAGTLFGPYEIVGLLGAGGMGEVYRARDRKLNRDVAVKVLPAALANDTQYMARFEREAQVLASLNHPNIATVYGIEQGALVMELVDGEDLKGPVPLEEVIPIARQITSGLEAAHERGVVHRDLKPANIKITPAGVVKILDFGLAKAAVEPSKTSATLSPTLSLAMTQAGMILGTAAYMSPEQARGKPVDKRSDIWAFGVVLYEMLTGRQLFGGGETVTDTLASVVKDAPDLNLLPPETPPYLRTLLERCLRKDVSTRLRDIGEARIVLENPPVAAPVAPVAVPGPAAPGQLRWWLAGVAAIGLAGWAIAVMHFRETAETAAPVRFEVMPPEDSKFVVSSRLSLSPDGRSLAFNTRGADGKLRIWLRRLDSVEARPLAGTEGASCIFWSPDSRWIGFAADGKLKKIEVAGGVPQALCNAPLGTTGGTWNQNGDILFSSMGAGTGLLRVSQSGGDVTDATTLDRSLQQTGAGFPEFLPDGRHFLYLAVSNVNDNNAVYVGTLGEKTTKRLLESHAQASYMPPLAKGEPGHLLFVREGALVAQPFDTASLDFKGEPFPVADQVWTYRTYAVFSSSSNGVLAYCKGTPATHPHLTWFDRAGKATAELAPPAGYSEVSMSRDGKMVAVAPVDSAHNRDIWLLNVERGGSSRFTFDPAPEYSPVWSPDSSRLVFASRRNGRGDLYQKDTAGTRNEELLLKSDLPKRPDDWSSDGQYLIYDAVDPNSKADLWVLPFTGDRKPRPLLQTPFNELEAQFRPGPPGGPRWVAYTSDESGSFQIYMQSFNDDLSGASAKFQVSTGAGGTQPRWRPDGKELFYIATGGLELMAVDVTTSPTFQAGIPHVLFPSRTFAAGLGAYYYSVSPDGQRFLILNESLGGDNTPLPATVVLNWSADRNK